MRVLTLVFKSQKCNFLNLLYDIPIVKYGCEKPLKNNSQLLANEMRFLTKMERETNRERIRNQAIKIGLGIIPIKQMTELVQFRWFGHVVRCLKMAWQVRTQGKRRKRRPQRTWEEGIRRILKERRIEWDGARAMPRESERWKAL